MGEPTAPQLPAGMPDDLREFLECRSTFVRLRNGPQPWIDGREVTISPGSTPGTARISVSGLPLRFSASVIAGNFTMDFGWVPGDMTKDARRQIDELNAWFRSNGYTWGPIGFEDGATTFSKLRQE